MTLAQARSFVLLVFFSTGIIIAARHYLFRMPPLDLIPYSKSSAPDDLEATLSWYAGHAQGALFATPHTNLTHSLILEGAAPFEIPDSTTIVLPPASASELLSRDSAGAISINEKFRSSLWWPGAKNAQTNFHYSPFKLKLKQILDSSTVPDSLGESALQVRLLLERVSLSETQEYLGALDLNIYSQGRSVPLAEFQQSLKEVLGTTEEHVVTLYKGEFGYYLPLTQAPQS